MKNEAFRSILIFVMAATLLAPLGVTNFQAANAAVPVFEDDSLPLAQPLSTEVRYVSVSSSLVYELKFKVIDPGNPLLNFPSVDVETPPQGFSLEKDLGPYWRVVWDTSSFADDPSFTSRSYLVTFVASDNGASPLTAELSIPFKLFKEDVFEPTLTMDKDSYLVGDTAYVTIFDPRKDSDGTNVAGPNTPLETIMAERIPGGLLELLEVDAVSEPTVRSGTFRTSFTVSEPLTIIYSTDYSFVQSSPIEVSAVGVKTDRELYSTGATARIIAVTSAGNPPDALLVDGTTVPDVGWFTHTDGFESEPPLTLSSLGEHSIAVSIDGATYFTAVRVEDVSAMFVNQVAQSQRSTYYSNETAAVVVRNHQLNQDELKAETISGLTVSTSVDPTPVSIDLLETGIDTGIFTGVYLIGFTTENDTDPDQKILRVAPTPNDSTSLALLYSDPLSPLGAIEATATVVTASTEESNLGIGDTSGSPVAASSIVAVTNLSCSSYGGDAERDGICDGWEAPAKTYLTIPYGGSNYVFQYWCDPDCPNASNDDILLEIDYQSGQGPTANVLPDIKTKFDQRGYKLHYRIDDAVSLPADNLLNVWDDPSGDNNCSTVDSFWEIKLKYFGEDSSESLRTDVDQCNSTGSVNNKGAAKKQVTHYCFYSLAAKQRWSSGTVGTSGISEEIGNDCIVTLGDFSPVDQNKEKGTLMHELGHMFGLRHGGGVNSITASPLSWIADSNANCKPNYISPMSYSHQYPNALGSVTLDNWTPSYSNYALTHYDASSPLNSPGVRLNETDGPNPNTGTIDIAWVTAAGASPRNVEIVWDASDAADDVDWNGGGVSGLVWNNNVNNFGFRDCDTTTSTNAPNGVIRGFRDWNKLVLEMRVHGGSNWDVPGGFVEDNEVNSTVWKEIIVSGIKVLNGRVQALNASAFTDPQSANTTKDEIESDLLGADPCLPGEVACFFSVVQLIDKGDYAGAIDKLSSVSRSYDGDAGGNATDDKIADHEARESLFDSTKGNFRTLVMELLEKDDDAFGIAWTNDIESEIPDTYRVIMAESTSVNATEGRFFVHKKNPSDPSENTIMFTVKGEGLLGLELDRGLVDGELDEHNTVVLVDGENANAVFSQSTHGAFFGSRIDFTVTSENGSGKVHEIVIMGQNIVPEFPAVTSFVITITVIVITMLIVIVARTKKGSISGLS